MLLTNEKVLAAQENADEVEAIIRAYEPFILASAAEIAGRHITKSDDEWSIALLAFYDSIQTYNPGRGHFLAYAKLRIRSRLIDYFRSQVKSRGQISIESLPEEDLIAEREDSDVQYEIQALEQAVSAYGFSYLDLVESSPKARKTKDACKTVIRFLLSSPVLTADMKHAKRLPVKSVQEKTGLPRKIIERHRKYIVTAIEILTGDYPHLAEYLAYIKEDDHS